MSLFDPWELVDAAKEHDETLYIPDVTPGDVLQLTRRRVVDSERFGDGRAICLIDTEVLEAMAGSPASHPDSNYLAEERSLETMLVQVDGMTIRNYSTGEGHVIFLDTSTVTLNHDILEPERVVVLEVDC